MLILDSLLQLGWTCGLGSACREELGPSREQAILLWLSAWDPPSVALGWQEVWGLSLQSSSEGVAHGRGSRGQSWSWGIFVHTLPQPQTPPVASQIPQFLWSLTRLEQSHLKQLPLSFICTVFPSFSEWQQIWYGASVSEVGACVAVGVLVGWAGAPPGLWTQAGWAACLCTLAVPHALLWVLVRDADV